MKKNLFLRIVFYVAGLLILALGIILNTKSGLGVSPIISVAYSITTIGGFNFGNITFLLYSAFVVVEIVLHIFRNHRYSGEAGGAIAPAAHRDLVVRIAGYSAYFVQLNDSMQEEVINRTEHTL